jgi:hypothetical protein
MTAIVIGRSFPDCNNLVINSVNSSPFFEKLFSSVSKKNNVTPSFSVVKLTARQNKPKCFVSAKLNLIFVGDACSFNLTLRMQHSDWLRPYSVLFVRVTLNTIS